MMGSKQYIPYLRTHDLTSYLHGCKDICAMVEKLLKKECLGQSDLNRLIFMEMDFRNSYSIDGIKE